jgi:chorismate-pyruvate lyase
MVEDNKALQFFAIVLTYSNESIWLVATSFARLSSCPIGEIVRLASTSLTSETERAIWLATMVEDNKALQFFAKVLTYCNESIWVVATSFARLSSRPIAVNALDPKGYQLECG